MPRARTPAAGAATISMRLAGAVRGPGLFDGGRRWAAAGWGAADLRPPFRPGVGPWWGLSPPSPGRQYPGDGGPAGRGGGPLEALFPPARLHREGAVAAGAGMDYRQHLRGGQRNLDTSVAYLHPLSALPGTLPSAVYIGRAGHRPSVRRTAGGRLRKPPEDPVDRSLLEVDLGCRQASARRISADGLGDRRSGRCCGRAGVPVRVALPGVGRNLADHPSASVVFRLREPVAGLISSVSTPYESVRLRDSTRPRQPQLYISVLGAFRAGPRQPPPAGNWHGRWGPRTRRPPRTAGWFDLSPNVMRPKSPGPGLPGRVRKPCAYPPRIALDYFSDPEGRRISGFSGPRSGSAGGSPAPRRWVSCVVSPPSSSPGRRGRHGRRL